MSANDVSTVWGQGTNATNQNHTLDLNLIHQPKAALKVGARKAMSKRVPETKIMICIL